MTDKDPFGKSCQIVMKKIRVPSATNRMESEALENVMDVLFSVRPSLIVTLPEVNENDVSLLGIEEAIFGS